MPNKQIFISLEVLAVGAILAGVGAYFYFVGIPFGSSTSVLSPMSAPTATSMPTSTDAINRVSTPIPTPREPDITATVTSIQGQRLALQTADGQTLTAELKPEAQLELTDGSTITVPKLSIGDELKIYLNAVGEIQRIEVEG